MTRLRRGLAALAVALLSQPAGAQSLPLGDGKISRAPEIGQVFACPTRFDGGGAFRDGPWIHGSTWDPTAKPVVGGAIAWPNAQLSVTVEGERRVVRANNLPSHPTGVFPIRPDDPAYQYDRNPNAIRAQDVLLTLPARPVPAAAPSCLPMGLIGVALSGAAIFNALDAQGRDAPAHEIQDRCNGHPEPRGQYHYHDLSPCLDDRAGGRHSELIGYALDGFGLYGRFGETGKALTNADLDVCHGHSHVVPWNGAPTAIYHYHVTREYPYTLGCFRGAVAQRPLGPPPNGPMGGPMGRPAGPPMGAPPGGPPPFGRPPPR